jgi:excisionase family DNA binding protein
MTPPSLHVVTPGSASRPVPEPPADVAAFEDNVLTVDEAARFLRIGRNQLYVAIGAGKVPHRRIGRTIRLSRDALVRWLNGSCGVALTKGHR